MAVLNDMLDSWSNEALTCFTILQQSAPIVAGKNQYTIGDPSQIYGGEWSNVPPPDFLMTRPLRLRLGPGAAYLMDTNNNRYPVDVIQQDRWNLIWNLQSTTSNLPDTLFYDPQVPYGVLNIWPMPNTGGMVLYWDSYAQLGQLRNPSDQLLLPPGYTKAIKDCLAIELWPYFKPDQANVPPLLMTLASKSKGNIKRTNQRENIAFFDRELTAAAPRPYNIYSDTYR
jgi:hypothetical protein